MSAISEKAHQSGAQETATIEPRGLGDIPHGTRRHRPGARQGRPVPRRPRVRSVTTVKDLHNILAIMSDAPTYATIWQLDTPPCPGRLRPVPLPQLRCQSPIENSDGGPSGFGAKANLVPTITMARCHPVNGERAT